MNAQLSDILIWTHYFLYNVYDLLSVAGVNPNFDKAYLRLLTPYLP